MATYKPWTSKEFLYREYVQGRKSIEVIAKECTAAGYSVTPMTIYNNLKKFDLIKNSRNLGKRRIGGNTKGPGKGFYG